MNGTTVPNSIAGEVGDLADPDSTVAFGGAIGMAAALAAAISTSLATILPIGPGPDNPVRSNFRSLANFLAYGVATIRRPPSDAEWAKNKRPPERVSETLRFAGEERRVLEREEEEKRKRQWRWRRLGFW
ncbi:hypothetical protein BHE74_00033536 [Ensete ventricosum]|nr:hypothetical protein BHE74_00033536 [Ensete ventricosum]